MALSIQLVGRKRRATWILVMKVGVRRFSNLSKAILRDCLKYRCCLIPNTDRLVGRKRQGRLDIDYESLGQKVECEMLAGV